MVSTKMTSNHPSLRDNKSTPFLLRLPTEILDRIVRLLITTSLNQTDGYRRNIDDKLDSPANWNNSDDSVPSGPGDIASLCRLCRRLRPIATDLLYREVDLRTKSDRRVKRFCRTIVNKNEPSANQVKGIAFDDFHTPLLLKALDCFWFLTTLTITIPDPGPARAPWTSRLSEGIDNLFFPALQNLSLEHSTLPLWYRFIRRHSTLLRTISIGKTEQGYYSCYYGGRNTPKKGVEEFPDMFGLRAEAAKVRRQQEEARRLEEENENSEDGDAEEGSESGKGDEPSDTDEASLSNDDEDEKSGDGEAEEDCDSGEENEDELSDTSEASLLDEEEIEDDEDDEVEEDSESEESSELSDTDGETEKKLKVAPKSLGQFPKLERFHGPRVLMPLFLPGSVVHTLSNAFSTLNNYVPNDPTTELINVPSIRDTIRTLDFGTFDTDFFQSLSIYAPGIVDVKCFLFDKADQKNFVLRISHTVANFKNLKRIQLRLMTRALLDSSPSDDDPHHFVNEYKTLQSWKELCPTLEVCSLPNRHRVLWKVLDDLWVPDWTDRNTRHRVLSLSTVQVNQHDFPWMKPFVTGLNQYYFFGEYDPHLRSNPFNTMPNADDKPNANDESVTNDKSSGAAKVWMSMFDSFGKPL